MKRILAFVLAFILCVGCACAEGMGEKLTQITLKVKEALDIGDEYTDFSSSNYDDRWDLFWISDTEEVSVNCDAEGKIYNYYLYEYEYTYDGDYAPRYPDIDVAELERIANEFFARVITGENEGWVLDEITSTLREGNSSRISVEARLTMMDIPTDVQLSITINGSNGRVLSFYRSDNYVEYADFTGDVSAVISAEDARNMLDAENYMELVYQVTDENEMARLIYKPVRDTNFAVRASDGLVIDLNENYGYSYATAEDAGAKGAVYANRELTEAELNGISVYENALTAAQIDEKLRAMPELGVTAEYELTHSNYYDNGKFLVVDVGYTRKLTEAELTARGLNGEYFDEKSFSIKADDGIIMNLYSYYPGTRTGEVSYDEEVLVTAAESFIRTNYPEYADSVNKDNVVYNEYNYNWERNLSVNFGRVHNGYPFRANYISVEMNVDDGTISGLHVNWYDNQEFYEPDSASLISAEDAYTAYLAGFEFEEAFLSVPGEKINDWEYEYVLTYAWHYRNQDFYYGVDAVTGEELTFTNTTEGFDYTDIAGHVNEAEISLLGKYGIGFSGGEFMPDAPFTAKDALTFIGQAPQYNDSIYIEARDYASLIGIVHDLGSTGLEAFAEDQQMTRLDFAKVLVDLSGYDKALALPGIYSCGFADDAEITEEDYPAIAIAYALGLIAVDADGNINAYQPLTRAEGAVIFHNLLSLK